MTLTVRCYAKLNLTLEALGRRADGYHDIATVMQTVSLADTLTLALAPVLTLACDDPALAGEHNLVYRAATLLRAETGCTAGAAIRLQKAIPVAAGLGGGSSNAAAALTALNKLWDLRLSRERLHALAARLGSDVPYFLTGGSALAEGRGERITSLGPGRVNWFVLLSPRLSIPGKTAAMYSLLGPEAWTGGRAAAQMAQRQREGRPLREALLHNAFDGPVGDRHAEVAFWRARLLEESYVRPHLTGSGPTLFIPVPDRSHGEKIAARLLPEGARPDAPIRVFVVHSVPHGHEISEAPPDTGP